MQKIKIIIASDSVGETAEQVAKACVSQFNSKNFQSQIVRYPYIETLENVDEVMEVAKENEMNIVVFTLVKPDIKEYMEQQLA